MTNTRPAIASPSPIADLSPEMRARLSRAASAAVVATLRAMRDEWERKEGDDTQEPTKKAQARQVA